MENIDEIPGDTGQGSAKALQIRHNNEPAMLHSTTVIPTDQHAIKMCSQDNCSQCRLMEVEQHSSHSVVSQCVTTNSQRQKSRHRSPSSQQVTAPDANAPKKAKASENHSSNIEEDVDMVNIENVAYNVDVETTDSNLNVNLVDRNCNGQSTSQQCDTRKD